jgi:hypothetical protein
VEFVEENRHAFLIDSGPDERRRWSSLSRGRRGRSA